MVSWKKILEEIQLELAPTTFDSLFRKTELNQKDEHTWELHCINEGVRFVIERKHKIAIVEKLKTVIPKQLFVIKVQAILGGKIVASEKISALRKDVTAKLYGGDVTRKMKLLNKQKEGKKRMAQFGKVKLPQSAYLALLKKD